MIEVLSPQEAAKLDSVFADEWGACVPDPRHSNILAEVDEGELVAFLTLEDVVLLSNVYVAPNHRGMKGARAIKNLIARVERLAPQSGRSFLMARHENRARHFAGMSERLGFRKYGDVVYRVDFFRGED